MSLSSIASHAKAHGILPLKKYGQNFIFDSSLCERIVKASGIKKNTIILEIGPGIGGLTRAILAHNPKSLTVIEIDTRCFPLLAEIKKLYPNLNIVQGDALKFDLINLLSVDGNRALRKFAYREEFIGDSERRTASYLNIREDSSTLPPHKLPLEVEFSESSKLNIISNLPYNIGTELLMRWLKEARLIESITIMLQKEVVDRICAVVNTKTYGRLSVITQLICKTEKCFDVSSQAFYPPPKVQSSIVKLTPFSDLLPLEIINKIELVTHAAFSGRRKMIKSSLKNLIPNVENLLEKLKIDNTKRAENLSPQDYLSLARYLREM